MAELNDELEEKIWMYLHDELDVQAMDDLLAEVARDDELARAFQARNELDLILADAFEPHDSHDAKPNSIVGARPTPEGDPGKILAFPVWRRITQLAAVLAVVVGLVYVLAPQDDLRWRTTQFARLDQSRAGGPTEQSVLDASAVKRACADLKQLVSDGYGDEDRDPWHMKLLVSEHAGGAFEIRVEGKPARNNEFDTLTIRRFDDISSFETNIQEFADAILLSLRRDEP